MMSGHGKSDNSVVPEKFSNKAEVWAEERMEGRGLAEGKTLEQTTLRTQSREGVPSALERIREAWRYHPRQEPYAVAPHVRIRAGGVGKPASLPRLSSRRVLTIGSTGLPTNLATGEP
jgi:hypothetical protein